MVKINCRFTCEKNSKLPIKNRRRVLSSCQATKKASSMLGREIKLIAGAEEKTACMIYSDRLGKYRKF